MNELIFFLHALLLIGAILGAARMGKEALIALIALCVVLANLFVVKQILLFGLEVTCADLYAVGGMVALNLLREFHGVEIARRVIWISFGGALLFTCMALAQLLYLPSESDWAHPSFATILTPVPRLMAASLGVYFVVQRFDLWLFGQLKARLPDRSIASRTFIATSISQLVDTALFTFVALSGLLSSLLSIIVVSYLIKLATLVIMTPLTLFAKRWVVAR